MLDAQGHYVSPDYRKLYAAKIKEHRDMADEFRTFGNVEQADAADERAEHYEMLLSEIEMEAEAEPRLRS